MSNRPTKKQIDALNLLFDYVENLTVAFQDTKLMINLVDDSGIEANDFIVEKYPFKQSFDDLVIEVSAWKESVQSKIGLKTYQPETDPVNEEYWKTKYPNLTKFVTGFFGEDIEMSELENDFSGTQFVMMEEQAAKYISEGTNGLPMPSEDSEYVALLFKSERARLIQRIWDDRQGTNYSTLDFSK